MEEGVGWARMHPHCRAVCPREAGPLAANMELSPRANMGPNNRASMGPNQLNTGGPHPGNMGFRSQDNTVRSLRGPMGARFPGRMGAEPRIIMGPSRGNTGPSQINTGPNRTNMSSSLINMGPSQVNMGPNSRANMGPHRGHMGPSSPGSMGRSLGALWGPLGRMGALRRPDRTGGREAIRGGAPGDRMGAQGPMTRNKVSEI